MAVKPDKITPRSQDYNRWYQDVIRQADLAEPAEVVRGCMVIKPHGYAIWEKMQAVLDTMFKKTGHKNAYFPLLIPESFLKREAEHVEGFAPELAVVTHAGGKPLDESYIVRPTSETIIGHFFAKWIESWRDLPLLINQWANVMRWEMRTRMFLRTSEFLWQEGHTAHADHQEAQAEVLAILDMYRALCHDYMAMPVIRGVKTASEKFAGALESHCIEAMMQDGKALQAGTSHDLGQNFGKAFGVQFQDKQGHMDTVWQTSWGVSTRLIGGLIMTHSDDLGLVLPPKLAPVQVVIIPIAHKDADIQKVHALAKSLAQQLNEHDIATTFDNSDHKPGYKYFLWEQKGVPLRLDLGPRDIAAHQVTVKSRIDEAKSTWSLDDLPKRVKTALDAIQQTLYVRAQTRLNDNTCTIDTFEDFKAVMRRDVTPFVMAHWDGTQETEAKIKEATKATIRCIISPLDVRPPDRVPGRCMVTNKPSKHRVLFAKNY